MAALGERQVFLMLQPSPKPGGKTTPVSSSAQNGPEGKSSAGLGSWAASWRGHSFGTDWTLPRAVTQCSSNRGGLRQYFRHPQRVLTLGGVPLLWIITLIDTFSF